MCAHFGRSGGFWRRIGRVPGAVWRWIVRIVRHLTGGMRRAAVLGNMAPADIILASPRTLSLTPVALAYRLLLRADYVHAMLYVGRGKMVHTTTRHGVVVEPVPRAIYRRDRYTILRARAMDARQRERVVAEALRYRGARLDVSGLVTNIPSRLLGLRKPLLRLEKNRLWCSKLIARAYAAAGVVLVPDDRAENVTSEDLRHSPAVVRL